MCQVYEFPVKKQIPEELKEDIQQIAKDYVQLMNKALKMFEEGDPTDKEVEEFIGEVILIYTKAIENAVDEI